MHPKRLYAHRGAAIELPENTLRAFERALELGADALEMDAHLSKDGRVVISHDSSGKRMCGVNKNISECNYSDIRTWDAGYGFIDAKGARPFAGKNITIPTLDQVLESFPNVPLNIDVKQYRPPMVQPIISVIRRHQAQERITLASFKSRTLARIRLRNYEGQSAIALPELLASLALPRLIKHLPFLGQAAQIPTHAKNIRLDSRWVIERLHQRGLRVDFWTINDLDTARALVALGADGIMTDDPRSLSPLFRQEKNER